MYVEIWMGGAVSQLQFVIFIQNQTKVNVNYNSDYYDLQDIDLEVMQNQTQSEYAKMLLITFLAMLLKKFYLNYLVMIA